MVKILRRKGNKGKMSVWLICGEIGGGESKTKNIREGRGTKPNYDTRPIAIQHFLCNCSFYCSRICLHYFLMTTTLTFTISTWLNLNWLIQFMIKCTKESIALKPSECESLTLELAIVAPRRWLLPFVLLTLWWHFDFKWDFTHMVGTFILLTFMPFCLFLVCMVILSQSINNKCEAICETTVVCVKART